MQLYAKVFTILNGKKVKDKRISRRNAIHKLSGASAKISKDAVTMALQVYSSLAITVLSHAPFALNIHIHILSGMEYLLKEVIHLCIAQFADITYYAALMGTSGDTDARKHEHISKAVQKMGQVKPQHGSV